MQPGPISGIPDPGKEHTLPPATDRPLLTCREVLDFLAAYLGEELPEAERAEFDRHLRVCRACVDYVEGYRTTVALARGETREEEPAEAVPEELVAAILASRRSRA